MKKYITLTIFLSINFSIFSQGVHGIVYGEDAAGKQETLIGAVLLWDGTRSGTITDISGHYSIGIPPGATKLIVRYVGYIEDTIAYSGQSELNIVMHNNTILNPVIDVVGEVGSTHISSRNPQSFQILNEKELCKAACCNLSESFETNASIDASFADAITGARQIRMLGLDGRYTQMMFDNVPSIRGLASTYGFTYVPGPWVKSIYIAKGVGSVLSGYESITGQINVAMKNPDNAEKLNVNAYAGSGGRMELNLLWRPGVTESDDAPVKTISPKRKVHLYPVFLAHAALSNLRTDMNDDGFLDNPLFSNIILRNEWHLETATGIGGQYILNYLHTNSTSGTIDYDPVDEVRSQLWGVEIATDRYEFTGKTGYVFKEKPWKSFGSQVNLSWHDQRGHYGFRRYSGKQLSGRVNLLFASRIVSDAHKFTTGISYQYDDYLESITFEKIPPITLNSMRLNRLEMVPGAFAEYTGNPRESLTIVLGLRGDYHNVYGGFVTPRVHVRYSFTEQTSVKLVGGRGLRTANILMDNVGVLASNRNIIISGDPSKGIFGLKMEDAWNAGLILTHKFKMNHRDGTLSLDAYRTQFNNQVVLDLEVPTVAQFYNLEGKSYSNSLQTEMQWSPIKRLDWRLAYRWLEARTQFNSGLLDRPLVNRHRAFTNVAYETKAKANGAQWRFDATVQWISKKRIPYVDEHADHEEIKLNYSPDYWQVMAQVTYVFMKNVELYVGGENLTNFMVHDAIISADNPSSENFDGSLVWGPVFGRMGYVGFRWKIP